MKRNPGILTDQNLWLKLIILLTSFTIGIDASIRQLIKLIALFLLYFLLEIDTFRKLLLALRKVVVFLTAYWILASIFATEFPAMLLFSFQIFFFLVISTYSLGTINLEHFMQDTRRVQQLSFFHKVSYVALATGFFIRGYFNLLQDHRISKSSSLSTIFTDFAALIRENFARADKVEIEVEQSFERGSLRRSFFVWQNLLAIVFLALVVLLGAL